MNTQYPRPLDLSFPRRRLEGPPAGTAAADAHGRAEQATSTRDRVSATIAAYRAEAALDDVLSGAWRRMSMLMEERGLR